MDFAQKKNKKFNLDDFCEVRVSMWQTSIKKSFVSVTFYLGKNQLFMSRACGILHVHKGMLPGANQMTFLAYQLLTWIRLRLTFPKKGNCSSNMPDFDQFQVPSSCEQERETTMPSRIRPFDTCRWPQKRTFIFSVHVCSK